jgi:hypothetical protein
MKVEVLYIAECPNHKPAVEQAREALRTAGMPEVVNEVEVRTKADAEAWRFLGSPTVRVNGLDVEPEARGVQHFGVGCRSYADNGRRSGLPSKDLIGRALQEISASSAIPVQPGSHEKNGTESGVLVAGGLAAVLASTCLPGALDPRSAWLQRRMDRQSLSPRTISSLVHRCRSNRIGLRGPTHLPSGDGVQTRRGLCFAGNPSHVQGFVRNRYGLGRRCARLPLSSSLFLLTVNLTRSSL